MVGERYYSGSHQQQTSYSRLDDPNDFYNRMSSYSPERRADSQRTSRYQSPSRPTSYAEESRQYSPSRPTSYLNDRPTSYAQSRSDPFVDPRQESSYADSRPLAPSDYSYDPPAPKRKTYAQYNPLQAPSHKWYSWRTRRGKIIILSAAAALVVILAIIIGVVAFRASTAFTYTPSDVHVTNVTAFQNGAATHATPDDTQDGIGRGTDTYKYYVGGPENFPDPNTAWVSFEDMWNANLNTLQTSCSSLGQGSDNTDSQIQMIYDAIQDRARASLVDHRFIFAIILQESNGCVHVGQTTSSGGVDNPGLMQSHNGDAFNKYHQKDSIYAMVQDGTQGTDHGAGLVEGLNLFGNPYSAARYYNSGLVPDNLSEAAGATACYVTDVANRLTGWVRAKSLCPGDTA